MPRSKKIQMVSIAFYNDTNAEENINMANSNLKPKEEICDGRSGCTIQSIDSDEESCDDQAERGEDLDDPDYDASDGLCDDDHCNDEGSADPEDPDNNASDDSNDEDLVSIKREAEDETMLDDDVVKHFLNARGDDCLTNSIPEYQFPSDLHDTDNPIKKEKVEAKCEVQKDKVKVEVKSEDEPLDNDPTSHLLSAKREVEAHIDRLIADTEEIRQINQFCTERNSVVTHKSDTPLNESPNQRRISIPNLRSPATNVIKVMGKPLLVSNGRLQSRILQNPAVGMPRKVLVVKAADIRTRVVGSTAVTPRPPKSIFNGSPTPSTNTTNMCRIPTIDSLPQRASLSAATHSNSFVLNKMLTTVAEERKQTVEVFFCKCCTRAFTSRKAKIIHEHVKRMEKPFKCPLCPKTFKLEYSRKMHYRTHTDERPYECPHCPKKFKTPNSLRNHQVVHTNERRYPCCFCQKLFKTKNCRKIHEITHADKVIECSFCPRTFRNDEYRKRHEMLHTNDRPYICNLCNKGFTRPATLKIHQICHSNERNIACRFCDKKFNRKEHAQRHEKIHLNDRQYQCIYCAKRFITSWKCKRHEKIHLRRMNSTVENEDG